MANNYATPLPKDGGGTPMQEYPAPKKAIIQYATGLGVSSLISLSDRTTVVEIGALGGSGAVIRWIPRTETAAAPAGSVFASGATINYDNIIPANSYRRFVVPQEITPAQSVMGANGANGLYNRMAVSAAGGVTISSVLTAEF